MRYNLFSAALAASLAVLGASASDAAVIYGLTDNNVIVTFDSSSPSTITNAPVLKTASGGAIDDLIGIDFRSANNALYGVSRFGAVYTIDPTTGIATPVSTIATPLNGSRFGFDFNPVADRLRIVSDTDQNLRVDVSFPAAVVNVDGTLAYAAGDINFGRNPSAVAAAYTNPDTNVNTGTTIYYLDSVQNVLATSSNPNGGALTTVGSTNIDFANVSGFDIAVIGGVNVGFAGLQEVNTGVSRLYQIDLNTGIASNANVIGGGLILDGLAIGNAIPEPTTLGLIGGAIVLGLRRRS